MPFRRENRGVLFRVGPVLASEKSGPDDHLNGAVRDRPPERLYVPPLPDQVELPVGGYPAVIRSAGLAKK